MTTRVRVGVLGPIDLSVDGQEIPVPRLKVRQLIAALTVIAPNAISPDQLIDQLWPGDLPNDPRGALRVVASRLRSTLGDLAGVLVTDSTGHRLLIDSDIADFTSLLAAARSADESDQRISLIQEALGLWRGDPLVELADDPVAQATISELLEAKASGDLLLAQSLLDADRAQETIVLTQSLMVDRPMDEGLAIALATAFAREGRKTDALETLDRVRHHLRNGLGLDPTDELQQVEANILAGAIDIRRGRQPIRIAASNIPFVGRASEIEALISSKPGITMVVGEPGSGKSALLEQAKAALTKDGFAVIAAAATASPERPMEVLATIAAQIIELKPAAVQESVVGAALTRLGVVDLANDPTNPDRALTRDGLVSAIADMLQTWATTADVVISIDDCQWLDRGTAEVLKLVAESQQCRVIAATRPNIPAHVAPLFPDVEARTSGPAGFALPGLTNADVREMMEAEIPALTSDQLITSLIDRSGGNPLFLSLLVELLAEGALRDGELPTSVLVAVQERMAAMSATARDTLQIASVFLDSFPLTPLRELSMTTDNDIGEALAARLVEVDLDQDRGRFSHQLVAEAAYQLLPEGRRVALHDEIGRLLEADGAEPAEYALHAGQAASLDPLRAVTAHRDAALTFRQGFAFDTALLHAREAQRHVAALGGDNQAIEAELLVAEGTSLRLLGDPAHEVPLLAGAELASRIGMVELVAAALIELCGQSRTNPADELGRRITLLLDEALNSDLPTGLHAELCAVASTSLSLSAEHERAEALYREGYELALRSGDPTVEARVLARMNGSLPNPADFPLRQQAVKRLRVLTANDSALRFDALQMALGLHMVEGDRGKVDQAIEELRLVGATHIGRNPASALCRSESSYARFVGDLERAESYANQLLELDRRTVSEEWTMSLYAGLITAIREAQGRLAELLPLADEMTKRHPDFLPWQMMGVACAGAAGEPRRVQRDLKRLRTNDFGGWLHNTAWWAGLSVLAAPVALVGDIEAARTLYRLLLPQSGLLLWNGSAVHQPADSALATLGATIGDTETAAKHRTGAAVLLERIRSGVSTVALSEASKEE